MILRFYFGRTVQKIFRAPLARLFLASWKRKFYKARKAPKLERSIDFLLSLKSGLFQCQYRENLDDLNHVEQFSSERQ